MQDDDKKCTRRAGKCPQADDAAEDAAEKAVEKVFAILGVDVGNPKEVEQFREDLRFGGKLRKAADHGFLALVGLFVVAIGAAVWAGIVSKISGGH